MKGNSVLYPENHTLPEHINRKTNAFYLILLFLIYPVCGFSQPSGQELTESKVNELFTDTIPEADSLLFAGDTILIDETEIPEEELNEFFSEKMDSLVNTWLVEKAFRFTSPESDTGRTFPVNLPDSLYIHRLKEMEQVIDLSYNSVVRNFIQMYTEKRRNQVEIMLGLSSYYFPLFEETLDKYDLPIELKYLPIIESALNPKALSRMGANGLWQFMYGTGKNMNLEINSFIDERRDPLKSTDAAARYLKQLFDLYGDWHLAIAAYNCGPGNVNRAIKRSGDKTGYWEIYYRLPRETRGYVPAFIAASYVMHYFREHNLTPRLPEMSLFADTLVIHKYLHFDQVASVLNIDKEELRTLNPMYRRDVIPAKQEKPYPLVLPQNKIMDFIGRDSSVFAFEREKYFPDNTLVAPSENSSYFTPDDIKGKEKVFYTVKQGDNPGFIASWFRVRTSDLNYWNNIHRNLIRAGQKLVIYVPEGQKEKYEKINGMTFAQKQEMIGKSATPASQPKTETLDPNFEYYTVRKGDTLWEIAQKYAGITSSEIMELNNLSSDRGLYIGQKLKIKRKS